jgi:hypothetical protein
MADDVDWDTVLRAVLLHARQMVNADRTAAVGKGDEVARKIEFMREGLNRLRDIVGDASWIGIDTYSPSLELLIAWEVENDKSRIEVTVDFDAAIQIITRVNPYEKGKERATRRVSYDEEEVVRDIYAAVLRVAKEQKIREARGG